MAGGAGAGGAEGAGGDDGRQPGGRSAQAADATCSGHAAAAHGGHAGREVMGFLTKLAGRQTEDEELVRFQQMTRKPEWDIVLEMLLFPVEEDRLNFHNLKGEALKEAQIRTEIYLKLLGQVEAAG